MRSSFLSAVVGLTLSAASADLAETKSKVVDNYAELVYRNYLDSYRAAVALREELVSFAAGPSEAGLKSAKEAWIAARIPYLQTEAFRFYNGPIDDENGPEGLLNAWPMDEAYLDGVVGDPTAGVIQNPKDFPLLTQDLFTQLNEKAGEKNISTGFHAIEFLLWGQDLAADGPGARPLSDFTTQEHAGRRGKSLIILSELLTAHLQSLVDEWKPARPGNYRAAFTTAPTDESLRKILTGISMLSGFEMASERLAVAYDTQEQEDEHSCFSDTTHIDINNDLLGIRNVWRGDYGKHRGTGLDTLALKVDEDLGKRLTSVIEASYKAGKAIPVPFDQAILGEDSAPGRVAILKTIESLEDQADLIVQLSRKLGFEVPKTEE